MKEKGSQTWWYISAIPALARLRPTWVRVHFIGGKAIISSKE
jgi:hypothetical protein